MTKKEMAVKLHHLEHLFQSTIKYIDTYIRYKGDAIKFDEYIHEGNKDVK